MATLNWEVPQEQIDSFAESQGWTPTVFLHSGKVDENGQSILVEKDNISKEDLLLNYFSNTLIEITRDHERTKAERIARQNVVELPKPPVKEGPKLSPEDIASAELTDKPI